MGSIYVCYLFFLQSEGGGTTLADSSSLILLILELHLANIPKYLVEIIIHTGTE